MNKSGKQLTVRLCVFVSWIGINACRKNLDAPQIVEGISRQSRADIRKLRSALADENKCVPSILFAPKIEKLLLLLLLLLPLLLLLLVNRKMHLSLECCRSKPQQSAPMGTIPACLLACEISFWPLFARHCQPSAQEPARIRFKRDTRRESVCVIHRREREWECSRLEKACFD